MLTATLLGAFGSGMVVVGPLKQASLSDSNFQTSSVIYEFVLFFCQNSDPASTGTSSIVLFQDFKTSVIHFTNSGPVPSPFITTAFLFPKTTQGLT